jgi:hypothetical protein
MSQFFNEEKMAVRNIIREQLQEGRQRGAQWMIRMRNTMTGQIFPLYVGSERGPSAEYAAYVAANGNHFDPIECYDFSKDLGYQLIEDRTANWDRQLSVQSGNFTNAVPFTGVGPSMPNEDPEDQR